MFAIIKQWSNRYFAEPQAAILLLFIVGVALLIALFGNILAPLLAGLALAYLLEAIISPLQKRCHFPRWLALTVVYVLFISLFVVTLVWLLPLLSKQFAQLLSELPLMLQMFHQYMHELPKHFPNYVSERAVNDLISSTSIDPHKIATLGRKAFSVSLASLPAVITWMVYIFLVPLLALFFLKDKRKIITWCQQFTPQDRGLVVTVWQEMQSQLGKYVRGKALEVIIVAVTSYIGFRIFNVNYGLLLGVLVGLSAIIPYVGMVIVTIPVVIVGLLQFGVNSTFLWMLVVYLVIQFLDGNLLVPILFSEAVNLHPIAIIAAVLFFGGLWGFWGLFFAIPLATLVKALIYAWRNHAAEQLVHG